MSIINEDETEVGRGLFLAPFTERSVELAGDELGGGRLRLRNGEREGCESDTIEDYVRSDRRPIEE